jgi:uncharacterized protein (TIGR03118 family)
VGNDIVVTCALHQQGQPRETDGPGFGYVDIFTAKGRLIQRLEHGDWLNAPWGVALAPQDFDAFSHDLLIGQFAGGGTTQGSGTIAIYDLVTGQVKGLLQDARETPSLSTASGTSALPTTQQLAATIPPALPAPSFTSPQASTKAPVASSATSNPLPQT